MWTVSAGTAGARCPARAPLAVPLARVARRAGAAEVRVVVRATFDERAAMVDRCRADALAVRARDVVARAARAAVVDARRVTRAPAVAREDARAGLPAPRAAIRPRVTRHRRRRARARQHAAASSSTDAGGEVGCAEVRLSRATCGQAGSRESSRLRGRAAPSRPSLSSQETRQAARLGRASLPREVEGCETLARPCGVRALGLSPLWGQGLSPLWGQPLTAPMRANVNNDGLGARCGPELYARTIRVCLRRLIGNAKRTGHADDQHASPEHVHRRALSRGQRLPSRQRMAPLSPLRASLSSRAASCSTSPAIDLQPLQIGASTGVRTRCRSSSMTGP